MATTLTEDLLCWNDTDADCRAWAQHIHNTLSNAGWVQTADTGQINLSTFTQPTIANEKRGYEIWRMNDALQATVPVFMRIDYGSSGSANSIGIWMTFGTGSNGSGTITTPCYLPPTSAPIAGTVSAGATEKGDCYGAGTPSWFACSLFVSTSGSRILGFGVERTHDEYGSDTTEGLLFGWGTTSGQLNRMFLLRFAAVNPPEETGMSYIAASNDPSTLLNEVWVSAIWIYAGVYANFALNWVVVQNNDFIEMSTIELFDGHCELGIAYKHMRQLRPTTTVGADSGAIMCMRFQ